MLKLIQIYRGSIYCVASALLITACSGGGGNPTVNTIPPNPDFVAKASALNFNRVSLYPGHVKDVDRTAMAELDTSNLNSGDLITIDVEFEITGELQDYSLAAQLVPQSILALLNPGTTIGEIFNKNTDAPQGEDFIDLGGVYIDVIKPGVLNGVFHAKLPVLNQDTVFKIAIMPSLNYLSAGKEINTTDIEFVPVLLDDRELLIKKLDTISVTLVETPDLAVENDFTEIEIGGGFDANGYSNEPIFQTSVKIDMSTFNDQEEVVLSLSWAHPSGTTLPLGLLSSNPDGTPVISTEPHFTIKRSNETSVKIPVVAYAPMETQGALIKQATFIRDIADQTVQTGNFDLVVSYVDNNAVVSAGNVYRLSLPLVSQDSRALTVTSTALSQFAVLRAGNTTLSCLSIGPGSVDVDSQLLLVDSVTQIIAENCEVPDRFMMWRYDVVTKQIVHKITDSNGDNYCITGFGAFVPTNYQLAKCTYKIGTPAIAADSQRFEFEGQKIKFEIGPIYLDVIFGTSSVRIVYDAIDAPDFNTDLNGIAVDSNGRLFYAGKFYDRNWGSADTAQVGLSFGGESYVDYLPVIGAAAEGHAVLSASLLGKSADLLNARLAIKRYLTKKLSILGNNYPDKVVGNGAELKIDVLGFSAVNLGNITTTNVTETYNTLELVDDILSDVPVIGEIKPSASSLSYKMDEKFLQTTFIVVIVPVTIEGGVEGGVDFNVALTTPGIGLAVNAIETFALSGYLSAKLDAIVIAAGIAGKIDVINQKLTFAISQGFSAPGVNKLSYSIGASLAAELKLLRGEVSAFVEYYVPRCCIPPWKKKRKEATIYSSGYLFNENWSIFNGNAAVTLIEY